MLVDARFIGLGDFITAVAISSSFTYVGHEARSQILVIRSFLSPQMAAMRIPSTKLYHYDEPDLVP